jgi:hypothetical protein
MRRAACQRVEIPSDQGALGGIRTPNLLIRSHAGVDFSGAVGTKVLVTDPPLLTTHSKSRYLLGRWRCIGDTPLGGFDLLKCCWHPGVMSKPKSQTEMADELIDQLLHCGHRVNLNALDVLDCLATAGMKLVEDTGEAAETYYNEMAGKTAT